MTDPAWVALSLAGRIGSKTLRALIDHFGDDPLAILSAEVNELRRVPGVGPKIAQSIRAIDLKQIASAIARWQQHGIHILTQRDPAYPARLCALDDAPLTLFVRGNWRDDPGKTVAIVGTRSPSTEARKLAQNLASRLVESGYIIISGLALGIDSAAHLGALAVPDGYTLGVLGCGVSNVYPPNHHQLAQAVMRHGAILSEVQPMASASSPHLVARNRIITGLSDSVIIIETETDGGAMHAARFAALQGRPIYTVDFPASGNQALLATGAGRIMTDLSDLPLD